MIASGLPRQHSSDLILLVACPQDLHPRPYNRIPVYNNNSRCIRMGRCQRSGCRMTFLGPCSRVLRTRVFQFAFLLLLIGALTGCNHGNAAPPNGPPTMPVKVQKVQVHPIGDSSEYVATIKSRHSATIMSDVEGWIFDIHVHSGQVVKKGETLMEIDPRRQQAAVSNFDSQTRFQGGGAAMGEGAVGPHQGALAAVRRRQQAGPGPGAVELRCRRCRREVAGRADRLSSRCS